MGVETSIVVEFTDGTVDDSVVVELDDMHPNNLSSDGIVKSSFSATDEPVFLIHHNSTVRVIDCLCTYGSVSQTSLDEYRLRESTSILFTTEDSTEALPYGGINEITSTVYGNPTTLLVDDSSVSFVSGSIPCIFDVSYQVKFSEQWQLTPGPIVLKKDEVFLIGVVVYMEKIV